jgi:hypothetical protein
MEFRLLVHRINRCQLGKEPWCSLVSTYNCLANKSTLTSARPADAQIPAGSASSRQPEARTDIVSNGPSSTSGAPPTVQNESQSIRSPNRNSIAVPIATYTNEEFSATPPSAATPTSNKGRPVATVQILSDGQPSASESGPPVEESNSIVSPSTENAVLGHPTALDGQAAGSSLMAAASSLSRQDERMESTPALAPLDAITSTTLITGNNLAISNITYANSR